MKSLFICIAFLAAQFSLAQQASLKGSVTDENKQPIPFATINVQNSSTGTVANEDGEFNLLLPYGQYNIRVSSMGYTPITLDVTINSAAGVRLQLRLESTNEALSEVEVFGNRFEYPDKIEALTRLPLAPYDQIQSISIISEKLIEQQGNLSISDATKNVPGVYTFATYGNKRESMSSRGFRGIPILKNGVRVNSDFRGVGILTDMQGVDNIQVLKGAAAITQGVATDLGSPGGVINLVTKTPIYKFGGNVSMRYGAYNQFRPAFDIYGPVNEQKNVAFRINGAFSNADSFREGVTSERVYLNPSLEWLIDDKSTLTLEMDYLDDSRTPDLGTINLGENDVNAIYDLPHDVFLGFDSDRSETKNSTFSVRLDRRLNEKLTIKGAYFQSFLELEDRGASLGSVVEVEGEPVYNLRSRGYSTSTREDDNNVIQLDLIGDDIYTAGIKHTFQIGADYRTSNYSTFSQSIRNLDQIDIFGNISNSLPNTLAFSSPKTGAAESRAI